MNKISKDHIISEKNTYRTFVSGINRWIKYRVISFDNTKIVKLVVTGDQYSLFDVFPNLKKRLEYRTILREHFERDFLIVNKF